MQTLRLLLYSPLLCARAACVTQKDLAVLLALVCPVPASQHQVQLQPGLHGPCSCWSALLLQGMAVRIVQFVLKHNTLVTPADKVTMLFDFIEPLLVDTAGAAQLDDEVCCISSWLAIAVGALTESRLS